MITLLAKLFIKNHKNYCDSKVRLAYGTLCAFVGIFFNILLFASKFIAGLVSKSVAITADAFNNLSDAASSIIQLFGFKLSSKEPDQSHPFGHGRFEYISGLIISFLILLMGFELLKSSVLSLFNPPELSSGFFSIAVMLAAIAVKCYMYFYNHITAILRAETKRMSNTIDNMGIMKPFSIVLEDEDQTAIADLYLADDDTIILGDDLMQGLDQDLDNFFEQLMK